MIKKLTLVLTGLNSGKSIILPPYKFIDGRVELECQGEDVPKHTHLAAVLYQAYPEGDPRIQQINDQVAADLAELSKEEQDGKRDLHSLSDTDPHRQAEVHSGVQSDGAGAGTPAAVQLDVDAAAAAGTAGNLPDGDGHAPKLSKEPEAQINEKLKRVVLGLDPKVDSNWIANGKPALAAVERAYGSTGLTRADVEAAAPDFVRPA